MFKRVNKKGKNSKQGVILVTVLFIVAMALILISCAVIVSRGTRTRVYVRAEDNQARLTVTAAAESFWQAIVSQEITDKNLNDLVLAAGAGNPVTIDLVDASVPGMAGTSNNKTTVEIEKGAVANTVKLTFKTIIDEQSETVVLTLLYTPQEPPVGNFAHQIEVSGGGTVNRMSIGMKVNTTEPYISSKLDNTILSRSDVSTPADSSYFYSTFISTETFTSAGSTFYQDVIFSGPNANFNLTGSTGAGMAMSGNRDTNGVFFIDLGAANNGFVGSGSTFTQNTATNFISQNSAVNLAGFHSDSTYFTGTTGSFANSGLTVNSVGDTLSANLTKYISAKYYEIGDTQVTNWPKCASVYHLEEDCSPASVTDTLDQSYFTGLGETATLAPGTYVISDTTGTVTMGTSMDDDGKPVITCDLQNNDYYFYIQSNFNIQSGRFEFVNGGNGHNAYFIISEGKRLMIGMGYQRENISNPVGILDMNCFTGSLPASGVLDACINQSVIPSVYIFGAGAGNSNSDNKLHTFPANTNVLDDSSYGQLYFGTKGPTVVTGYVGLYPSSETANDGGCVFMHQGDKTLFYGRITAYSLKNGMADASNCRIPYCPAPSSERDATAYYSATTCYSVIGFQYYVDP